MSNDREIITYPEAALRDARGEIVNVFTGALAHVAVITSKVGSVRAGHYHRHDVQRMFLVSGRYRSVTGPVDNAGRLMGPTREVVVNAGALAECPPGVGHVYEFLEDSVFLNLNTVDRAPAEYDFHTTPLQQRWLVPCDGCGKLACIDWDDGVILWRCDVCGPLVAAL